MENTVGTGRGAGRGRGMAKPRGERDVEEADVIEEEFKALKMGRILARAGSLTRRHEKVLFWRRTFRMILFRNGNGSVVPHQLRSCISNAVCGRLLQRVVDSW